MFIRNSFSPHMKPIALFVEHDGSAFPVTYGTRINANGTSTGNTVGLYVTTLPSTGTQTPVVPNNLAIHAEGDVFVSGTTYLSNPAVPV
ncbi:hypothetical protein, partial [Escherichia coli]|uniref:hypothetical protein n=1 Tax=Escherichia coli TaxID=562 RepID=UPI001959E6F3